MQLRFMGQTYTATNTQVETVATQQTATFKGNTYQIRVPVSTFKAQQPQLRKYRGVTYTVEPQRYAAGANGLSPCY